MVDTQPSPYTLPAPHPSKSQHRHEYAKVRQHRIQVCAAVICKSYREQPPRMSCSAMATRPPMVFEGVTPPSLDPFLCPSWMPRLSLDYPHLLPKEPRQQTVHRFHVPGDAGRWRFPGGQWGWDSEFHWARLLLGPGGAASVPGSEVRPSRPQRGSEGEPGRTGREVERKDESV